MQEEFKEKLTKTSKVCSRVRTLGSSIMVKNHALE